jgi:hypothetical protein
MHTQLRHPPWENPPKVLSLRLDSWHKDMPGRLLIIHSGWMLAACNMQTSSWELSVSTNEKVSVLYSGKVPKTKMFVTCVKCNWWSGTSYKDMYGCGLKLQLSSQDYRQPPMIYIQQECNLSNHGIAERATTFYIQTSSNRLLIKYSHFL